MSTSPKKASHVCRIGDIEWTGDNPPDLDDRICGGRQVEPWLSAILQAEHLSLLLGNGITTAAVGLAGGTPISMSGELALTDGLREKLEAEAVSEASRMGRGSPNVEDRLRVALTLETALHVLGDPRATEVRSAIDAALASLCTAVLSAEATMDATPAPAPGMTDRYTPTGYVVSFLLAFGSRTPTRDRLHIFTTNYDPSSRTRATARGSASSIAS
jgi:hypothetical protein